MLFCFSLFLTFFEWKTAGQRSTLCKLFISISNVITNFCSGGFPQCTSVLASPCIHFSSCLGPQFYFLLFFLASPSSFLHSPSIFVLFSPCSKKRIQSSLLCQLFICIPHTTHPFFPRMSFLVRLFYLSLLSAVDDCCSLLYVRILRLELPCFIALNQKETFLTSHRPKTNWQKEKKPGIYVH